MAVGKEEVEVEVVEILKPCNDKREYRRIVLQNSLQVLLISDPETDKCAASMNVAIGSFSDPFGFEGLAHFLGENNLVLLYFTNKFCVLIFGFAYFDLNCCRAHVVLYK
ncbi:hypothetical protein ACSBR2_020037 [Camellia fascicularis]